MILIPLSSCDYVEVQTQLAALLGLHSTANSRILVTSIASFAAKTNTETAYKQFCEDLYQIGVTEDMTRREKARILDLLKSQSMVCSSHIGGSKARDQGQVLGILGAAYKRFFQDLYHIGVTEDMLPPKEEILDILRSRGMVASSQSSGRNTGDKGQLGCSFSTYAYIQPLTHKQVIILAPKLCHHSG